MDEEIHSFISTFHCSEELAAPIGSMTVGACMRASWAPFRPSSENLGTFWESSHICDEV